MKREKQGIWHSRKYKNLEKRDASKDAARCIHGYNIKKTPCTKGPFCLPVFLTII